ncbi:hypothetical protein N7510_005222 [Penicillium lagena]|uniref:uncharacterized protein n=1 Tax=Penicillium lagena TaxID=94218 RepID=UPI002540C47F|nr:uncharacterized protein N7510_005222 [Penicillium lagena]KAJ5612028.1 hypothetical protein N7510_005222 [Penicillium lagena]
MTWAPKHPDFVLGMKTNYHIDRYYRTIYRICVSEVVGVRPEDVDTLYEHDMSTCRMLDLKKTQGQSWDDRTALKRLLTVGL